MTEADLQEKYSTRKSEVLTFLGIVGVAILFALITNRVWEDYYITYKHSKNLALGFGLQYDKSERVHGFTSPLGTIIPALFAWLTTFFSAPGEVSDRAALWMFRIFSACCLGAAGVFILRICRRLGASQELALFAVFFLAFDSKSIDFTINGMETGILELFVVWSLYNLISPSRPVISLGLTWAGLMWTRPDGCFYIGAMALAFWFFEQPEKRLEFVKRTVSAGCVCAAAYLPWFVFAWLYYGSPVPHTIKAKGGTTTFEFVLYKLINLPFKFLPGVEYYPFKNRDVTEAINLFIFAPSYLNHPLTASFSTIFFLLVLAYLLFGKPYSPGTEAATRNRKAIALSGMLMAIYLYFIPRVFPWYFPGVAIILMVAIPFALGWIESLTSKRVLSVCIAVSALSQIGMFSVDLTRIKAQQSLIEDANRTQIGLWLKEYAQPGSTVFLECLGYIGYFSDLKMLDFPGLVAPSVVAARKSTGTSMGKVVEALLPDYLVLRPVERDMINEEVPAAFSNYELVKIFSVRNLIDSMDWIPWRYSFLFDSTFGVFKRKDVSPRRPELSARPGQP